MRKKRKEKIVVCDSCKTPHSAISKRRFDELEKEHKDFLNTLDKEGVKHFKQTYLNSRNFDLEYVRFCSQCGNTYKNFSDAEEGKQAERFALILRR